MSFDVFKNFCALIVSGMILVICGCALKHEDKENPSFRIISASTSRSVEMTEDSSYPIGMTDVFTKGDRDIVSYIQYSNISGRHNLRWEWFSPDGSLYYATKDHVVKTSSGNYARHGTSWHKIPVGSALKHNSPGKWKVNIFFDDALVASNFFQLKSKIEGPGFGNYHALVIGNNKYMFLKDLVTAENDAKQVASALKDLCGFRISLLLNASRADIILALNNLRNSLTEHDNLLIFYAGHGFLDVQGDEGYWLPVDAKMDNEINWISNSYISTVLKAISARHVLILSDSCYSGKLTRDAGGFRPRVSLKDFTYYTNIAQRRSRCVISSGGLEPVIDGGGRGGHSVFTTSFIDALSENPGMMDTNSLFTKVRHRVMLNSSQTPEYSDLRHAGHEGGEFVFVRR